MLHNSYTILGVKKDDSIETIRKKYKEMALKYHPDRNPNTEEKFKEINNAYHNIINNAVNNGETNNNDLFDFLKEKIVEKGTFIGNFIKNFDRDKMKTTFFNELRDYKVYHESAHSEHISDDLHINIYLNLEEIYLNVEKIVTIELYVKCHECILNDLKVCNACSNSQRILEKQYFVFNANEKCIMFPNSAHYETNKKRGNLVFNIYPKHEKYSIFNDFSILWNVELRYIKNIDTIDFLGSETINIEDINEGGLYIFKNKGLINKLTNDGIRGDFHINVYEKKVEVHK